jgi:L-methionine (R)-S-oxide reductase
VLRSNGPESTDAESLLAQVRGLLDGERDPWANAANVAALIWAAVPRLNWCGFYFQRGGELVLGPFQGRPACVRIAHGRGVCGAAAASRRTQVVPDVHAFPGHIACDTASNSELVVPLVDGARLIGVLDLDSPDFGRFHEADARLMERVSALLVAGCDWNLAGIDRG